MNYILEEYDQALETILTKGSKQKNRTGIDTLSIFGMQCRYKINERFPLLTGRKIWPKAIFAELIWFLSGSTNNNDLVALGSNIWTSWVSKEFEKKNGYANGDFGPIYGHQLRKYDGPYTGNMFWDGFDQWKFMIETLKKDPNSRRNLFDLWNPTEIDEMRLPPCHFTFQVYVESDKLSGCLTQRSADFPIGVPANIQFYSALIYILAKECGYQPWELIHNTNDSHIYENQIDSVRQYLQRTKPDSPYLDYTGLPDILCTNPTKEYVDCFKINDYNPLDSIKIPVAV